VSGVAVRTESLTKRYGAKAAVDRLTFEVPAGAIFGFLGPNGAGKTTTFSLLCGFVRADEGAMWILQEPSGVVPRARMSALPQDARFHPARTVADSLRFLAELSGMDRGAAAREVDRVIEAVGLQEARGKRGRALSHGMAKRFGIAQAFLGSPELVLLDEPTEGLDPRTAKQIRELIRSLKGRSTVVVSSHNLAEVEDICDHAAIIDHGRLVTAGSIADLTGADEQVVITLGRGGAEAADALRGLPDVRSVEASEDGLSLRVALRPAAGSDVESAITTVLSALIRRGATIGAVGRGRSLEERFLEVT
jgi:ABC-type multidrug transport system ATPase subunit